MINSIHTSPIYITNKKKPQKTDKITPRVTSDANCKADKSVSFGNGLRKLKSAIGINSAEDILGSSKEFGVNQYKTLSKKEKTILSKAFEKLGGDPGIGTGIIKLAEELQTKFNNQYGKNNYAVISLGRSASSIVNALKYKGVDTAFVPGSGLQSKSTVDNFLQSGNLGNYKKYMKKQGVDAATISKTPQKKYSFIDYTVSGSSLNNFEKFLKDKKVGLNLPNVEFRSVNEIFGFKQSLSDWKYNFFEDELGKDFSTGFNLYALYGLDGALKEGLNTSKKLNQFYLISELDKQGKLGK